MNQWRKKWSPSSICAVSVGGFHLPVIVNARRSQIFGPVIVVVGNEGPHVSTEPLGDPILNPIRGKPYRFTYHSSHDYNLTIIIFHIKIVDQAGMQRRHERTNVIIINSAINGAREKNGQKQSVETCILDPE